MTKNEALTRLQKVINEVPQLQQIPRKSPQFEKWQRDAQVLIKRLFPDQPDHLQDFDRVSYFPGSIRKKDFRGRGGTPESEFEAAYVRGLDKATAILESMREEVQAYWKDESAASMPLATDSGSMWDLIHPAIANVARTRFESDHYADAVRSCS
jgi:hypothetical protein